MPKQRTQKGVPAHEDPRFIAAVDLVGRTGAKTFQMRYCDEEEPTVWMAIGEWDREGKRIFDVGASTNPLIALFRLLDEIIDGGFCAHCNRPSGFSEDMDPLPLDEHVCWYQWDPSTKKFARGCE